jgi:type IV pilus assembly protein PilB
MRTVASSSSKSLPQPDTSQDFRNFRRRKLAARIAVADQTGELASGSTLDVSLGGLRFSSSAPLRSGLAAIATLEFEGGLKIKAPIELVWANPARKPAEYGARFERLSEPERLAVLDAVFASPGTSPLGTLFDVRQADSGATLAARRLTPAHHAYYARLIRRIEQIHQLTPADTDRLLFAVLQQGRDLSSVLLELHLTTYDKLQEYLASLYGVPYVNLGDVKPSVDVADIIPESIAASQNIIAIQQSNGKYVVAMADPLDLPARDIVYLRTKDQFELRFALIEDVENAVKAVYQAASLHAADRLIDRAVAGDHKIELYKDAPEIADLETLRRLSDATPIISLVDSILRSAVEERASDVHLEPVDDSIFVRFRLDGVMHEMRTLPRSLLPSVVSRIKIMAGMDITERHLPQDGRISMRYTGKDFELRVLSVPTVFGEKVVVRLLEKNPSFKTLRSIGFSERNYALFEPLIRRPYGMILFCGPTGSGKTTTLFACIQEVNDGTTNIMTVEDPVEYRVRGVNHVELRAKRGLTFPTVLRSLLRSDPDVIYVGEIRDLETAELAVRAALTGHLLFSTLHTNTAIQAITRLVDIGVDPTLIGASLLGVVGQRLVRKVCDWCKESYKVSRGEASLLHDLLGTEPPKQLFRGRGCSHCHDTGFYGRLAVHEVIAVDEELSHLISTAGSNIATLKEYLKGTDFKDLRADAADRLVRGETTLQEMMRVVA